MSMLGFILHAKLRQTAKRAKFHHINFVHVVKPFLFFLVTYRKVDTQKAWSLSRLICTVVGELGKFESLG